MLGPKGPNPEPPNPTESTEIHKNGFLAIVMFQNTNCAKSQVFSLNQVVLFTFLLQTCVTAVKVVFYKRIYILQLSELTNIQIQQLVNYISWMHSLIVEQIIMSQWHWQGHSGVKFICRLPFRHTTVPVQIWASSMEDWNNNFVKRWKFSVASINISHLERWK